MNGKAVSVEDIKIGLKVDFPSGMGGTLTHKCVKICPDCAEFESTNKDYPGSFVIKFNQPDFTPIEFDFLQNALISFSKIGTIPTGKERSIVIRAVELGYAFKSSYTQAGWTEEGIDAYRLTSSQ